MRTVPTGSSWSSATAASARSIELEHVVGVVDEDATGVGQRHVAPAPFEQRHPDVLLEGGELLRDGARGVAHGLGGGGDRAAPCDLAE